MLMGICTTWTPVHPRLPPALCLALTLGSAQPFRISPLDSTKGIDLLRGPAFHVEEIIEVLEELPLDALRQNLRDPLAQQVHFAEQQTVVFFRDDAVAVEFRVG